MVDVKDTAEQSGWRENVLQFGCPFGELGPNLLSCASCQRCESTRLTGSNIFLEKNVGPRSGSMVRRSGKTSLSLSNMEGLKEGKGAETGEDAADVKEIMEQDSLTAGQFSKGDSKKVVLANPEV